MTGLTVAPSFKLPLDLVTQTIAILAKRRAGKSYTMRRIAEQLFKCGQQIVLVDPKGDQWGIRSAADGKGPGLSVIILGGERGDVPLEPNSGEVVAKLVVEERVSVVLDLSLFRKHEVATFMTGFLENLYRLKAKEIYRTPVMVVIDEADAIAPQKPQKGEERMLGAAEDIVRRGGQRGIGCVLVTQRSAVLNKNVLTQAQMLVSLRTIAPQDLAAMDAWIQVHGEPEQRKTLMESLPSLPVGDAWFWSPGWPTVDGIFKRVHVLPIETFDSGATPKPGEKRVEPRTAADVDIDALKRQMAETVERAKAENPKLLKQRIAQLEKELSAKPQPKVTKEGPVKIRRVEVPVVGKRATAGIQQAAREMRKAHRKITEIHKAWGHNLEIIGERIDKLSVDLSKVTMTRIEPLLEKPAPVRSVPTVAHTPVGANGALPKGEMKILIAVAQHAEATRTQLTILTGYKRSSRDAYVARLKEKGYIETRGDNVIATQSGVDRLGASFEPLPARGEELRRHWLATLPLGEKRIFETLVNSYPRPVSRDDLSEVTGYKRSSRDAYLARLAARKLIETTGDGVLPSDFLFQ